jgi:hypothetical protein
MQSRGVLQRNLELVVTLAVPFLFMGFGPSLLLDQKRIDLKGFDSIVLSLSFLFPIYLVVRFNRLGVTAGAICFWLLGWLEGHVLFTYDQDREGSLLDAIWILFGWIFCYTYCVVIYFFKFGILTLLKIVQNAKR